MLARLHHRPRPASFRRFVCSQFRHASTTKPRNQAGEPQARSQPPGSNGKQQLAPSQCMKPYKITTILTGDGSLADKTRILTSLHNSVTRGGTHHQDKPGTTTTPTPFNAALVLASRSLAAWLDDPSFVAPLLRMTGHSGRHHQPPPRGGISVLSAVVDGVVPSARGGEAEASEGFAVVQGYGDEILPGLWEEERREGRPGLVFRVPGLGGGLSGVEVAVPVTNTVFQNGRTSTLFASRWEGDGWEELRLVRRVDVGKRVVRVPSEAGEAARVSVPLVSITSLRPVGAALGNILKTLVVDGQAVPASGELEANVPMLLESRRRMGLGEIPGPLNVWALVVPARLGREWRLGALRTLHAQPLLAEGCRLHRVLSGGGGWGAKQGLLSLDPEAQFETTDEEDVERFERDFLAGRLGGSGGGSVVGPGDQVVFCVDAATYPSPAGFDASEQPERFKVTVRPEAASGATPIQRLGNVDMRRVDDFFGVVSKAMFLAPVAAAGGEGGGVVASMKIDTPGAELSVGRRLREPPGATLESPAGEVARELGARQDDSAFEALLQNHELQYAKFLRDAERAKA